MEGFGSAELMHPFSYGSVADGVQHNPTLEQKIKKKYWKTKQTVIQKLHKSQDEFVVAGDADIDRKLEVAYHLRTSCQQLLHALEKYCYTLRDFSTYELVFGEYLGAYSENEYTNAGEVMQSTGKVLQAEARARTTVIPGLERLYEEMATFHATALNDLNYSMHKLEKARTDYRAALLWMKDVSAKLHNPDYRDQLIRFREAQAAVKDTKASFEKLKGDLSEKIDMVNASRCNLLSRSLPTYQKALLSFTDSAASEFHTVLVNIRSHHHHQYRLHRDAVEIRELEMAETISHPFPTATPRDGQNAAAQGPLQSGNNNDDDDLLISMGTASPPHDEKSDLPPGGPRGDVDERPLVPLTASPGNPERSEVGREAGVASPAGVEGDLLAMQRELFRQPIGLSTTGPHTTLPSQAKQEGDKDGGGSGEEEQGGGEGREEGGGPASMALNDLLGLGLGLEGEGGDDLAEFGLLVSSEGPVSEETKSTDALLDQWNNFSSFMRSTRSSTPSAASDWEKEFMEDAPASVESNPTSTEEDPFLALDPLASMKRDATSKEGAYLSSHVEERGVDVEPSGSSSLMDELLSLDLSVTGPYPPPPSSSPQHALIPVPLLPSSSSLSPSTHPPPLPSIPPCSVLHPPFSSGLSRVGVASSIPALPQHPMMSSLPRQPVTSPGAQRPSMATKKKETEKKTSSWMNVFAHLDPLANEKA